MGKKKNKKNVESKEDGEHEIVFTVTIAKAIPNADDSSVGDAFKKKKQQGIFEAPKAQNYYHLEYKLLPTDGELVKTDVVTFGFAAKIYTESDSKVLKTWKEGTRTWVAWTYTRSVRVTKELLLKLFNHTVELRIWDTKDKVAPKARFDRPKAFKVPGSMSGVKEEMADISAVQNLVLKQTKSLNKVYADLAEQETKSEENKLDKLRNSILSRGYTPVKEPDAPLATQGMVKVQLRMESELSPQFSRLAELAGVDLPITERELIENERVEYIKALERQAKELREKHKEKSKLEAQEKEEKERQWGSGGSRKSSSKKSSSPVKKYPKKDAASQLAALHVRTYGVACVPVNMAALFSTEITSTTAKLDKPAGSVKDIMITVSLDRPLLSSEQLNSLNPMVIKVLGANDLPKEPVSHHELRDKCHPAYIKYKFFKEDEYTSPGKMQHHSIAWNATNVVLLGLLDREGLEEYLKGPPFVIEVHDRDKKREKTHTKPQLFGENPEDEMIGNVNLVSGRRTTHNPFKGKDNHWDPYGIAKFDLSGLLLGQRQLNITVPIVNCQVPDYIQGQDKGSGSLVGRPGNVDGPEDEPMPTANYLEAGSELKLRIDLATPLTKHWIGQQQTSKTSVESEDDENDLPEEVPDKLPQCPYGRIIFIFEYNNGKFLRQLQREIVRVNAKALSLDHLPWHVMEAALSTYKLSKQQKESKVMDIITGFQVLDGAHHIFVLEGLYDKGIKHLWTTLPRPQVDDPLIFNVMYNSDMKFSERLYAELDVDLCRVRLHESLAVIVSHPLLYVRDMVPKPCFAALNKLDNMLQVTKLRQVASNDLFPSAEMVVSMSREFGVPLSAEDFGELESEPDTMEDTNLMVREDSKIRTSRPWTPLVTKNPSFEIQKKMSRSKTQDYIRTNILRTRTGDRQRRSHTIAVDLSELHNKTAHNYSTQTLNSTELAKEKLRDVLSQDAKSRFTYSFDFNSATVVPDNLDSKQKESLLESKQQWRTSNGFVYPGVKTAMESNQHWKKPDFGRLQEISKPWRENILHANKLKPTVDRLIFPWEHRKDDFDVLRPPQPFFQQEPVTIHSAGDVKDKEIRDFMDKEKEEWKSRIVTDDTLVRTHRILPKTELISRGLHSSNQLSKLEDVLKDDPQKLALRKDGLILEKIPALSVVNNPSVDTEARKRGTLVHRKSDQLHEKTHGYFPGPFDKDGWLLEKNKIPITNMQHSRFQELKGDDFRLYFKEPKTLSTRKINQLTTDERDNHLFPTTA